ncbi:MIP/aquaporin family protein [Arthrobacter sp. 2YAF22_2]|uniref:MIP/aquaporin family protein n=1 Tax=Arthrobacter sp. 2YAF22_2 TaxID=3233029 RepID=UPI003F8EA844
MTMPVPASEPRGAQPSTVLDDRRPGFIARLSAEALGTLFVVVVGLGVALFAIPQYNPIPSSLAAGLALTAAMLAFGYLSGGHFNPAVTVGNAIAGRIRPVEAAAYLGAQLVGALLGALALFGVLRTVPKLNGTQAAFDTVAAGFDARSVIQAPLAGVLLVEVLGTALLVAVYLGTTAGRNPARAAAPFAVGLTMAVLLQLGQSIGNAPFNPARATASALFSNPDALGQLWLFWVAPLVGAAVAGLVFRGFAQTPVRARAGSADQQLEDAGSADADDDDLGGLDDLDHVDDVDSAPAAPAVAAVRETAPARSDEARDFFDKRTP